jgi:PhnB protein
MQHTEPLPSPSHSRLLQPYLFFGGRCQEAIDLYCRVLDAKLEMSMRFDESPEPPPPGMLSPGREHQIMHAALRIGPTLLMMSDGCSANPEPFQGFSLSLSVATAAEVDRLAHALAEGGEVCMAPAETFWSPRFASIRDRFGLSWMVQVLPDESK